MIAKQRQEQLRELDTVLLTTLSSRLGRMQTAGTWRNATVRRYVMRGYTRGPKFEEFLELCGAQGLFNIRIERRPWVDSDGERRAHTLARAAVTDMWPMGTHYWLRDNAIIGARFVSGSDARRKKIGKDLLLSGLSFISSVAQLGRFRAVIRSRTKGYERDPAHWPFIFAGIKDNLACQRPEPWAHKQDAWQILAWHVLDALEVGAMKRSELTPKHREFLGLIVPFLTKVSWWRCENSGSWEEIAAIRTSVRAWEHRLIVRLGELSLRKEFSYLNRIYRRERRHLPTSYRAESLAEACRRLDKKGSAALVKALPFEAATYARRDVRCRREDGALLYLLELDYIPFLAARCGKDARWAQQCERQILSAVLRLQDSKSGGIARYQNDSYQRSGFFRHLTVAKLNELYGAPSADASQHFSGREHIVPKGRKAAWTHFVWQIATWAGRRYVFTGERWYRQLHERYFHQGLKLVTGSGECSVDMIDGETLRVIRIPAWRMPECYIADRDTRGKEIIFPSPHTPLNWATAEMLAACDVRRAVLARAEKRA